MLFRIMAILTVLAVLISAPPAPAFAEASAGKQAAEKAVTLVYSFLIDSNTAERGITIGSEDGGFQLGFFPKVLAGETRVVISQLDKSQFEFPENWQAASDVYLYEIENGNQLNGKISAAIQADEPITELKKIFIFTDGKWKELDSRTINGRMARISLSEKSAQLILLQHEEILEIGHASWYKYKNCLCAASPDYPKGAKLKVQNLDNGKEVVVTVNDYGPDRSIFPERVIDLDKAAFKKLGKLGAGVLKNVKVTKVE